MADKRGKLALGIVVAVLAAIGLWFALPGSTGSRQDPASPSVTSDLENGSSVVDETTGSTGRATSPPTATDSTVPSSAPTTLAPPPRTFPTTTTLPPADDPEAGSLADDPVPVGEAIVLGDWQIGVSNVMLDATEFVLDYVDFNEPPGEGDQYVMVELSGVNQGESGAEPVFDWALVRDNFVHVPDGLECGVIPESIYDVGVTQPGGQFSANLCFEVSQSEASQGLLLTLGMVDETGRERFFSLD